VDHECFWAVSFSFPDPRRHVSVFDGAATSSVLAGQFGFATLSGDSIQNGGNT
jgi:hypothetical protein